MIFRKQMSHVDLRPVAKLHLPFDHVFLDVFVCLNIQCSISVDIIVCELQSLFVRITVIFKKLLSALPRLYIM